MTFARFEARFSALDHLPESLYATVVTHHHGDLVRRVEGILQWREALLMGELPRETALNWPEPKLARTLLMRLETLELASLCYQQPELTDAILKDICDGITSAEEYYSHKADSFVDKLAQRQKIRDKDSSFKDEEGLADHVKSTQQSVDSEGDESASTGASERGGNQRNGDSSNGHSERQRNDRLQGISPVVHKGQASESEHGQLGSSRQTATNRQQPDQPQPSTQQGQCGEPYHVGSSHTFNAGGNVEPGEGSSRSDPNLAQNLEQKVLAGTLATDADSTHQGGSRWNQQSTRTSDAETHSEEQRIDTFEEQWQRLAENWQQLSSIYKELPGLFGSGWDLTAGHLRTGEWKSVLRYQELLKDIPELKKMVDGLGRSHVNGEAAQSTPKRRYGTDNKREEVMTPLVMMEAGGIERTDSLSRMLPAESMLLGHPRLNILWHAKRAEHLLLSYQYNGLLPDQSHLSLTKPAEPSSQNDKVADGMGPIIICLDTSGSMQGEPEQIAKALCLEVIRIARKGRRDCYLYSFGSRDELIEYFFESGAADLSKLFLFLRQSFHGGTDLRQPLSIALKRQQEHRWQNADILLLSDGRFPIQFELFERIKRLKKDQRVRIHGILLGNWRGAAMEELCDPMHRFTDWHIAT